VLGVYNQHDAIEFHGCAERSYHTRGGVGTQKLELSEIDDGKTFEIDRGGIILVRLAEAPATGYKWKVYPVDDQVITVQDSEFLIHSGTGIGGGGESTFTFKAQSPGTTKIRLQLEHPWEQDSAIKRFEVTLHVK